MPPKKQNNNNNNNKQLSKQPPKQSQNDPKNLKEKPLPKAPPRPEVLWVEQPKWSQIFPKVC